MYHHEALDEIATRLALEDPRLFRRLSRGPVPRRAPWVVAACAGLVVATGGLAAGLLPIALIGYVGSVGCGIVAAERHATLATLRS